MKGLGLELGLVAVVRRAGAVGRVVEAVVAVLAEAAGDGPLEMQQHRLQVGLGQRAEQRGLVVHIAAVLRGVGDSLRRSLQQRAGSVGVVEQRVGEAQLGRSVLPAERRLEHRRGGGRRGHEHVATLTRP